MEVVAAVLQRMNVAVHVEDGDVFRVEPSQLQAARPHHDRAVAGFPSDLVSLVTVLATQAEGRTLVHDWMYELRLFALEQMSGMRADLFLCDPHRIIVTGPTQAARPHARQPRPAVGHGADCRGAGRGRARAGVAPLETVERGYGRLVERLQALGAQVTKLT